MTNASGRPLRTKLLSKAEMMHLLPQVTETLSLGQAHLLRHTVTHYFVHQESSDQPECFAVTAYDESEPERPFALAICSAPATPTSSNLASLIAKSDGLFATPQNHSASSSSVGSLLHASRIRDNIEEGVMHLVHDQLRNRIDQEFTSRDVRLVRWTTNPVTDGSISESVSMVPQSLSFEHLAIIKQMEGLLPLKSRASEPALSVAPRSTLTRSELTALTFEPLDWQSPSQRKAFRAIVEATYEKSYDAADLSKIQTTSDTLQNYVNAANFSPKDWYVVQEAENNKPVGCLIMAHSRPTESRQRNKALESSHEGTTQCSELIYLGLLPEYRGQRRGCMILQEAAKLAAANGSDKMLLAVDEKNHPASMLYSRAGLSVTARQSVWLRIIPPQAAHLAPPKSSDR